MARTWIEQDKLYNIVIPLATSRFVRIHDMVEPVEDLHDVFHDRDKVLSRPSFYIDR